MGWLFSGKSVAPHRQHSTAQKANATTIKWNMAMTPAANQQWAQVWWSCWQVFKWFCNSVLLCWRPCSIGGASLTSAAAKAMNNAKFILMGVLKKRHSSCRNCAWIQLLSFLPTVYSLPWLCPCSCCLKRNAQTWAWPSTKNGFHKRPEHIRTKQSFNEAAWPYVHSFSSFQSLCHLPLGFSSCSNSTAKIQGLKVEVILYTNI